VRREDWINVAVAVAFIVLSVFTVLYVRV